MSDRRGFVLLAVLIVVGAAVFVATGVLFLARGEVAGFGAGGDRAQSRACAWSGAQAVASILAAQRSDILAGRTPTIDAEIELWEDGDATAVARLLPVGPNGELLVGEASKLNLATVDVEALERTRVVTPELAAAVLAARGTRGSASVESLAGADGLAPQDLLGALDEVTLELDEESDEARDRSILRALGADEPPRGLLDLLTAFAFDPPLRADGSARLDLSGTWDDSTRRAVDELLGEGAAAILESAAADGDAREERSFATWRASHPDPREWHAYLDAITFSSDTPAEGKLDLMRASVEALRGLPELDDAAIEAIVRERDTLPSDSALTPAWLVERGIVTPEAFATLAPRLAMRSLFWRVRVAGGIVRGGSRTLERPVVLDVVIDVTGETARLALLRDVTALETTARLIARAPELDQESPDEEVEGDATADDAAAASETSPAADDVESAGDVSGDDSASDDEPSAPPAADGAAAPATPLRESIGRWKPSS